MSTRPTHATVEPDQLQDYVGYQVRNHVVDKRSLTPTSTLLTIAHAGPGEMPGTTRIVTEEYPEFHTDVATPIEVFAPLGGRSFASPGGVS